MVSLKLAIATTVAIQCVLAVASPDSGSNEALAEAAPAELVPYLDSLLNYVDPIVAEVPTIKEEKRTFWPISICGSNNYGWWKRTFWPIFCPCGGNNNNNGNGNSNGNGNGNGYPGGYGGFLRRWFLPDLWGGDSQTCITNSIINIYPPVTPPIVTVPPSSFSTQTITLTGENGETTIYQTIPYTITQNTILTATFGTVTYFTSSNTFVVQTLTTTIAPVPTEIVLGTQTTSLNVFPIGSGNVIVPLGFTTVTAPVPTNGAILSIATA